MSLRTDENPTEPVTAPRRRLIMTAVMAAMFMAALEGTVVGTAMPSITRQLGSLESYSWVFSSYLLSQTITSISFGRLADAAGRKKAIVLGLSIFLIGSVVCGLAQSMSALIAFRAIQGIGAGAILPLSMTIIGDLFPPAERGKAQSLVAAVFGTSSVVGPVLGGLIVDNLNWSWVFWVNLPIGTLAIIAFSVLLPEHRQDHRQPFNLFGNVWFALMLTSALLAVSWLGTADYSFAAISIATAVLIGLAFARSERRASAPVFDPAIWRHTGVSVANLSTMLGAMAIIGVTVFLPLFMQIELKASPTTAGLALTAVAMGWPIGATTAGWYQLRLGLVKTMQCGALLIGLGTAAFATLNANSAFLHAAAGSFLMGGGMGLLTSAALMLVQEAVPKQKRGSATSANVFARNLGSVLGASLFGTIFNIVLQSTPRGFELHELEMQLSGHGGFAVTKGVAETLQIGLHAVFLTMAACAICALLVVVSARGVDDATRESRGT